MRVEPTQEVRVVKAKVKKALDAGLAQVQELMTLAVKEGLKIEEMNKDELVSFLQEQARLLPERRGRSRAATAIRIMACAMRIGMPQLDW